ncbi:transglycosylase, partial [Mycobacterium sp. ITM-2017-0098]
AAPAPVVDVANVAPLDAPVPAPADAPSAVIAVANWDGAPPAAPGEHPQLWSLGIDAPLQPAPGVPPLPPVPPAPVAAPNVVAAAPAPDPLAPLGAVDVPGPAYDVANQAISGELPVPAEMPHLFSPENLPPGTAIAPTGPDESANVTYLKEIWHAIRTQEISGSDALLALTQRPMTTPDTRGGPQPMAPVGPAAPLAAAPAPGLPPVAPVPAPAPAPLPAPAPVLPPA